MTTILTIPRLEMSMTEGTLAQWIVPEGAEVKAGDAIYVLETQKAAQEVEAPTDGRLVRQIEAGQVYAVGTEIGAIE